jgi:ABC-type uncharacterized transport system involved in gliding motility auxiliary subunit
MTIPQFNNFRTTRKFHIINLVSQTLLGLSLLLGINILATKIFVRHDLTQNNRYTLSAETKACIRSIDAPIDIVLTIPEHPEQPELKEIQLYLQKLLREYLMFSQQSGQSQLSIEHLDYYRQTNRTLAIQQINSIEANTVALLIKGERSIKIQPADLFEIKDQTIVAFKGEQALTSALISLTKDRSEKIYFLQGHGEMGLNQVDLERGLSELKIRLLQNHFQVAELDLSMHTSVPDDADLLIIPSPQGALLAQEQDKIRRYMTARNGSLIVLIDPGRRHGLEDLFYDWGILVDDLIIVDPNNANKNSHGDYVIKHFASHEITKPLRDYSLNPLWGIPRPIRVDPAAANKTHLEVMPLIDSSKTSWAERDYRFNKANPMQFDAHRDWPGPVSIAVAAQRNAGSKMGLEITGGRIVVFGNSDFISNRKSPVFANQQLIQQSINWTLQNSQSLNIPVKKLKDHQLVMSDGDLKRLLAYFMIPPVCALAIGLSIGILRKK